LTALHFAKLVDAHFYDHKFFHRRVSNFVLQGGCPRGDGMGSLDYTIASEFTSAHFSKGQIGWASAGPHTESCQIFFMLDEAYHLDGRYTNMGKITKGLEQLNSLPLGTEIVTIRKVH
jgi:cyclophilin family peptidyl-prolyl cis-trans isomerase